MMSVPNAQEFINHRECFSKPKKKLVQTRIVFDPVFGFSAPARLVTRRPVPNATSIAHTPFFSTADPSLTCLFRLPIEIRLQILRYLLLSDYDFVHQVCVTTQRLVFYKDNRPYHLSFFGQEVSPEILRCSRACEEEGARILYGENRFKVANCRAVGKGQTVNSWPLPLRHARLISRLRLGIYSQEDESKAALTRQPYLFPQLRHLTLHVRLTCRQFENLLDVYSHVFRQLKTFNLCITIDEGDFGNLVEEICYGGEGNIIWMQEEEFEEIMCISYKAALIKHSWFNKKDIEWNVENVSHVSWAEWVAYAMLSN